MQKCVVEHTQLTNLLSSGDLMHKSYHLQNGNSEVHWDITECIKILLSISTVASFSNLK